jgi:hypothetical protein
MSGGFNPEWFIGVVELVEPGANGRVKVRCFGYHPDVTTREVETNDLPWAWVVNANFNKMFNWPEIGNIVFGFFMDGRDAQRPMILGTISGGIYTSLPHNAAGIAEGVDDLTGISGDAMDPCTAYDALRNTGLDHNQAIGALVNMHRESGLNPGVYEFSGGGGIGLFQYTYPARKDSFTSAVPDWQTNPVGQINYAIASDPLGQSYKNQKFGSAVEAADWFTLNFENPADSIKSQYVTSLGGSGNSQLVADYEKRISQCVVPSSMTTAGPQ